ncbi:uncharacterized protein EI90DRAFT_3120148 [Cantharellus anzutake]|uniref:uncharacterized protein n=1 Tax=Cantharellus anzutake TaxID=1750568 RepID=UPI001907D414|nr:uncharacterized protein EI90DRAFT_3120148 [Cantharellus anzutake]KAF8335904.1 hypothetical protein EI90DRAFT_3120148 [Cantharellus anzutake]
MTASLSVKLRELRELAFSRKGIGILKGSLAITFAVLLPFIDHWNTLNKYPQTWSSSAIYIIASYPGKPVGETFQFVMSGVGGGLFGAAAFVILAKCRESLPAQAVVFGVFAYLFSLTRAYSLKYFAFALLGILMAFDGVYTSVLTDSFSPRWLASYSKTYFDLLSKTVIHDISEEERKERDCLAKSIRADYAFISQKLVFTGWEPLSISRFTLKDYQVMTSQIRSMHLHLIALYSSLVTYEKLGAEQFAEKWLKNRKLLEFESLHLDIGRTVDEIASVLKTGSVGGDSGNLGPSVPQNREDVEKQDGLRPSSAARTIADTESEATSLGKYTPGSVNLAQELRRAFKTYERSQKTLFTDIVTSVDPSKCARRELRVTKSQPSIWEAFYGPNVKVTELMGGPANVREGGMGTLLGETSETSGAQDEVPDVIRTNTSLMRIFSTLFAMDQFTAVLAQMYTNVGASRAYSSPSQFSKVRNLKLHSPLFSNFFRSPPPPRDPRVSLLTQELQAFEKELNNLTTRAGETNQALSDPTVFSQNIDIEAREGGPQDVDGSGSAEKKTGIPEPNLSMRQALALLQSREYKPHRSNIWVGLERLEAAFISPTSMAAAKVTGACLVFGTFFWAEHTRSWFILYNIYTSLLTLIVCMAPTLGQSIRSFIGQTSGHILGTIYGTIVLEVFKNVGGHHFNPYGIIPFVFLYFVIFTWMLHERPQWFAFALLSLNGAATQVMSEQVNVGILHSKTWGSPGLRLGRSITGLLCALGIVVGFQVFILRNPARTTLRKAASRVVYAQLSYHNILTAFAGAALPLESEVQAPEHAVQRVGKELVRREAQIQGQLMGLMPLISFAKDEPDYSRPFKVASVMKIYSALQIMLDRHSEARSALTPSQISPAVIEAIMKPLRPYHHRIALMMKNHLSLIAGSLLAKTPLPRDTDLQDFVAHVTHDAAVLSIRFSMTPEGKKAIENGDLTRIWFYILTMSAIADQIRIIEEACKEIFGEIEEHHRLE